MQGAREYATLFQTGQHGRLYLVSSSHARGKTFRIFVLPAGVQAQPNRDNAPLNKDAVEVYGITGGQPGWTETYGWLYEGRWCDDFAALVDKRRAEVRQQELVTQQEQSDIEKAAKAREIELLAKY